MNDTTPQEAASAPPAPAEAASTGATQPVAVTEERTGAAAAPRSGFREWLLRRRAVEELFRDALPRWESASELRRRARLAAEAADRVLLEPEPGDGDPSDFAACEYYRQAVCWALAALEGSGAEPARELGSLWRRADRSRLEAAAGGPAALVDLEPALLEGSMVAYAEKHPDEQTRLAWQLRPFVHALLEAVEAPRTELNLLRMERATRLVIVGTLLLLPVIATAMFLRYREEKLDLASGRSWRASSQGAAACRSPAQYCDETPSFFFHTQDEKEPWVELELGGRVRFSKVTIINRADCCQDRAAPLVVEISDDRERWKQVARRDTTFGTWRASFPSVTARYVRVRATRKTFLHLKRVRVLP